MTKKEIVLIENDAATGYNLNTDMQPGDLMDLLVSIICKIGVDNNQSLEDLIGGLKHHYDRTLAGDQQ